MLLAQEASGSRKGTGTLLDHYQKIHNSLYIKILKYSYSITKRSQEPLENLKFSKKV